jgi:nitric oxide synthase-interacting protein
MGKTRHSKNAGDKHHFTYNEKKKAGIGSAKERFGTDSQLPFGHCNLSMHPAEDPVISPSGHLYSKEAILEYLLFKAQEQKRIAKLLEAQQNKERSAEQKKLLESQSNEIKKFTETQNGVDNVLKRKVQETDLESSNAYLLSRKKVIDDTTKEGKREALSKVAIWAPQFTPAALPEVIKEAPKRPPSPFSGRPLRSKDLIPVVLTKEEENNKGGQTMRYICPVTRKTITTQKVVLIKTSGVLMLETALKELANPTMTCPLTGKKYKAEDVLELKSAASGFSSSGNVEGKIHRPSIN